jgi:hypothetical protein
MDLVYNQQSRKFRLNYFFFFLFSFVLLTMAGEKQHFYDMTSIEIDSLLTVTAAKNLTVTERMRFYSGFFLGTPYEFTCVGDGKDALYEPYPLVNFDSTNCMAYCEHVLALAISDSWDNFFNNLQQIRYKDGVIGMRTRNHYTMADWLPENSWLLDDVSASVGGSYTRQVTRTISHRKFFQGKGISDMRYVIPDREITIDYIPRADLLKIKQNLRSGDIGALIFDKKTDIFSAHMWMVMEVQGQTIIRESTTRGMTTFDTPYDDWAARIAQSERYIGISLMRVREDLNRPGKIILPWQICGLKKAD